MQGHISLPSHLYTNYYVNSAIPALVQYNPRIVDNRRWGRGYGCHLKLIAYHYWYSVETTVGYRNEITVRFTDVSGGSRRSGKGLGKDLRLRSGNGVKGNVVE